LLSGLHHRDVLFPKEALPGKKLFCEPHGSRGSGKMNRLIGLFAFDGIIQIPGSQRVGSNVPQKPNKDLCR
jgi:hypothetical protein